MEIPCNMTLFQDTPSETVKAPNPISSSACVPRHAASAFFTLRLLWWISALSSCLFSTLLLLPKYLKIQSGKKSCCLVVMESHDIWCSYSTRCYRLHSNKSLIRALEVAWEERFGELIWHLVFNYCWGSQRESGAWRAEEPSHWLL